MNKLRSYNSIIKSRNIDELPFQKEFVTSDYYDKEKKPTVLAMSTSAGKTLTTIIKLEIFYRQKENKTKISLIVPASKTLLRENFISTLNEFKPSFSYIEVTTKKELINSFKTKKYNVIVCLPQLFVEDNFNIKNNVHYFILDEAHQWYFQKTVNKIISKLKPKVQILLTGTPSSFIAKKNDFVFKFVSIQELYDLKLVSNVKLEVISSPYRVKEIDYISQFGNLKNKVKFSRKQSEEALKSVCKDMFLKIGIETGENPEPYEIFGKLNKTIIFCHSIQQSNDFFNILNKIPILKDKVVLSHSKNDLHSEQFEKFKSNNNIQLLLVVDRGRIGYNMTELFNIVDFTMTKNLNVMLQMYGRLLRKSKKSTTKVYFKVSSKENTDFTIDLMTAMLSLTNRNWYTRFNGKNVGGILIIKGRNINPNSKVLNNQIKRYNYKEKKTSFYKLGFPMDLNFFTKNYEKEVNENFNSIAYTTLDKVRREFYNLNPKSNYTSKRMLLRTIRLQGIDEFKFTTRVHRNEAKKLGVDLKKVFPNKKKVKNSKVPLPHIPDQIPTNHGIIVSSSDSNFGENEEIFNIIFPNSLTQLTQNTSENEDEINNIVNPHSSKIRANGFNFRVNTKGRFPSKNRETILTEGNRYIHEINTRISNVKIYNKPITPLNPLWTDIEIKDYWNEFFHKYGFLVFELMEKWDKLYLKGMTDEVKYKLMSNVDKFKVEKKIRYKD
jgi:superfamily II DNA or RNA helicase